MTTNTMANIKNKPLPLKYSSISIVEIAISAAKVNRFVRMARKVI
jgi:hypothetical protein